MIKILKAQPLPDFRVRLRFADGIEGVVDLSHLAGNGVFAIWSDADAFDSVSIGSGRYLQWGDDVELCADALYIELTGKSPEDMFPGFPSPRVHA